MRNIPVSGANDASDYRLNVYLTVDSPDNEYDAQSKVVSVKGDATSPLTFNVAQRFFMRGTINGSVGTVDLDQDNPTKGDNPSKNFASFTTDLKPNDSFKIVANNLDEDDLAKSTFKIYDSSCLTGTDNPVGYFFKDNSGNIRAEYEGSYIIYLNKSGELWQSASNVVRKVYVSLEYVSTWWNNGEGGKSAWTALYAFGASGNRWYKLVSEGDYLVTQEAVDPKEYNGFNVVRMKPSADPDDPNSLTWDNKYYNQTNHATISGSNADCIRVWDGETDGKKNFDWKVR